MKKVDLSYMGGFFDGEGYVAIDTRLKPEVSIGQNEKDILTEFKEAFGGSISMKNGNPKMSKYVSYCWQIKGEGALSFLQTIVPFLKGKKKQAMAILKAKNFTQKLSDDIKVMKRENYTLRGGVYA